MVISRRRLVRGLGAGVLGTGALAACTNGRRGRGRGRATTTAPTGAAQEEPDVPLVLGSIGVSYGRAGAFEKTIAIAVHEAMIDVNERWKGLFGHEVEMTERHVMEEVGEDLTDVITSMADSGVTAVITSIDEDALIAAIPAFVEAGIAVIDVFTSGMSVRAAEVQSSGMLVRLAPNDRAIAALYAEEAWAGSSDKGGDPGTVAYVSEDTAQGQSLLHELEQLLNPEGGKIVSKHFYPFGKIGTIGKIVEKVLESPPALLVVNGGPEAGRLLSELYKATLDEGQRPTVEFPTRLSPAATVDYADEQLAPECLTRATGFEPGGELTVEHVNMMLNVDPGLLDTGYAYSQQAYDAVILAGLAAQNALSVQGTDIASSIRQVLTGTEECTDYGDCRSTLRVALEAGDRATISFVGRMGALELGDGPDPRTGDLRTYSWTEANEIETGEATSFEVDA
ncbi:ABC transporter substrate-binding protein [Brachybacterium sp. GCM10030267]|uniref:ABC transporter substrate-binding protein n=1 Tax=Brachybacterium sp. GCM10030267 TaxID=3273381 RepID=UPI00361479FC